MRKNLYENLLEFHVLDFFGDLLCVGLVLLDGVGHAAAHLLLLQKLPRYFANLETVNTQINGVMDEAQTVIFNISWAFLSSPWYPLSSYWSFSFISAQTGFQ